jgi:ATP-dependent Clp protease ATP-binding subunit ClpA
MWWPNGIRRTQFKVCELQSATKHDHQAGHQDARDPMRPEIFDWFDRVLVFNRLSYEVQIEVRRLHLQWEIEARERRGHKVIECDAEALKAIVRNGYSEKQGARRIRNAAREAVQEVIREALLSGGETRGRLEYNGHSKSFFING